MDFGSSLTLSSLSDYTFEPQEAQPINDEKFSEKMMKLEEEFEEVGARRTALGVLLVHDHSVPHCLVIKLPNNQCQL
jgi:cleavage and polyadenylation specificity factor subunit 5